MLCLAFTDLNIEECLARKVGDTSPDSVFVQSQIDPHGFRTDLKQVFCGRHEGFEFFFGVRRNPPLPGCQDSAFQRTLQIEQRLVIVVILQSFQELVFGFPRAKAFSSRSSRSFIGIEACDSRTCRRLRIKASMGFWRVRIRSPSSMADWTSGGASDSSNSRMMGWGSWSRAMAPLSKCGSTLHGGCSDPSAFRPNDLDEYG